MSEGVVAGRLEIPVESSTKGFKEKLKAAVEKAAEGVVAKIGVELDSDGLRKRLQTAVDEAAVGVSASIGIDVDEKGLKAKLIAAAKGAGGESIKLKIDDLTGEVTKETRKAQATAKRMPLSVRMWLEKNLTGDTIKEIARAQAVANAKPVKVKVQADKSAKFDMPDWLKSPGGRGAFMPAAFLGIASVIQPAIAAIGGSIGGLVAMLGNLLQTVNLLGAGPGVILALGSAFAVMKLAVSSIGGPIKDLPKPLRDIRKEMDGFTKSGKELQKSVGIAFWSQLKGQIKPLGDAVMPILNKGLSAVATTIGTVAKETAEWMRSPLFKGELEATFVNTNILTRGFGDAIKGVLKAFLGLSVAAGPVLQRFAKSLSGVGAYFSGIASSEPKMQALGKSFAYAYDKAQQVWDMVKNLWHAVGGIFDAGRASGDSLLKSLQGVIKQFNTWANSAAGQNRMKEWFEAVKPVVIEVGKLIVDLGKSLARLSEDSHTAELISQIRTQLLPSLETFLRNLGSTLGPQVVAFITNVLSILTTMSAAGSPLANGLKIINQMLASLNEFLSSNPLIAQNLGSLLGALIAFRALTFFSGLIPLIVGFATSLRSLTFGIGSVGLLLSFLGVFSDFPGPVQGAVVALSAFLLMRSKFSTFSAGMTAAAKPLGSAFQTLGAHMLYAGDRFNEAGSKIGGFKGKVAGVGSVIGYTAGAGLRGAASGLMSLMGGPWGIALAAATVAVTGYFQAQENARQAAKAFSDTIDQQTGALTEQSKKWIANSLLDNFDADGWKKAADETGISIERVTTALAEGGPKLKSLQEDLDSWQSSSDGAAGGASFNIQALGNTIEAVRRDTERGREMARLYGKATGEAGKAAGDAADGIDEVGGSLKRAAPPAELLADAIDRIAGTQLSARESSRNLAASIDELSKFASENSGVLDKNGEALKGQEDAGRRGAAMLDDLAKNSVTASEAALRQGDSVANVTAKMKVSADAFVAHAVKMGMDEGKARTLASQLGMTAANVQGLSDKVKATPGAKTITMTALTASAEKQLTALGFTVVHLPNGQVSITAHTAQAAAQLDYLVRPRTMNVYVRPIGSVGAANGAPDWTQRANGGITQFLNGGINAAGAKIKSFARGAENHIAQIARPGEWRVWAEEETGGEAYIPLGGAKRSRSTAILENVAQRFGYALQPVLSGLQSSGGSAPSPMSTLRSGMSAPSSAAAGGGGSRITFERGAIEVNNPVAEPASKSVPAALRKVGVFGLFGEAD